MNGLVQLEAVWRGERHAGLDAATAALSAAGGWLLDVNLYSDLSACLRFEVPAASVSALAAALDAAGLSQDAEGRARLLEAFAPMGDRGGTLVLHFATGRGDLRHEKPAVPG